MAEADGKSTVLNGKGSVQEVTELFCFFAQTVSKNECMFLPGGSEEKEPGEDQHGEGDASGSKEGQTQSSQDGSYSCNSDVLLHCYTV